MTADDKRRLHVGRGCALAATVGLALIAGCGLAAHLYDRHWEKKVEARLAEYRAAGQPVTWPEVLAARRPVPDDQNSALILLEAFKQLAPPEGRCKEILVYGFAGDWTGGARHSEQVRGLVEEYLDANRAALATIRKAAVFRQGAYPMGQTEDFQRFSSLREAFRLCYMEACYDAESGEAEQAARAVVRGRRAVASIGEGVEIIEALIRIAGEAIWAAAVQHTLEVCELPAEGLQALRGEVAQEDAELSLELAFRGERSEAQYYFSDEATRLFHWSSLEGATWRLCNLIPARRHKDALFYYEVLDRTANVCRLPLRERCQAAVRVETEARHRIANSRVTYAFSAFSLPTIARCVEAEVQGHARLRVADAALAVEQWRLAHGRWPDSLDELVPELLAEVPDDPFCEQKIRYRRTDDGVVVYSVGPDGRDEGGRTRATPSIGFLANPDIPFRLLDPELRGARTLTFYEELMGSDWALPFLGDGGYTQDDVRALGLSEEEVDELGSRYRELGWW